MSNSPTQQAAALVRAYIERPSLVECLDRGIDETRSREVAVNDAVAQPGASVVVACLLDIVVAQREALGGLPEVSEKMRQRHADVVRAALALTDPAREEG